LARWLGVSHCVGSVLCYWLVIDSGQVVSKTLVEHVTCNDYLHKDIKKQIEDFDKKLKGRLDNSNFILQGEDNVDLRFPEDIVDDNGIGAIGEKGITPMGEEYGDMLVKEHPEEEDKAIDKYLNMELTPGVGTDDKRWGLVVK
jgi:hypothetical protein